MVRDERRAVTFAVPGRLDTITGGYVYDRRSIEGLRAAGWRVSLAELPDEFPVPSPNALTETAHIFEAIPDGAVVVVDGLAFSAIPEIIEHHAKRLRLIALVHLPLAADITIDRDTAARRELAERRALAAAAAVIVTGTATLVLLERYALNPDKIAVVEPGTDRAPVSRGSLGARVQILTVATVNPGKGHEALIEALATLDPQRWHLACAGSLTRHPETVARLRLTLRRLGLESNVSLMGELDESRLSRCYAEADIFVLATLQETYGMAVAEALAHGLPVISTRTGAIPDLVGDTAGLVVAPGDGEALAGALRRVLGDDGPALRARFRDGALRVRDRLPSWDDAVRRMSGVLDRVHAHG